MQVERARAETARDRDRSARRAAEVLAAGGLVIHPTETVYGIGGDTTPESNGLISLVKRRPPAQPLIVLTPDRAALLDHLPGLTWTAEAELLAERFWPGPLTLVIPCVDPPAGLAGPGGGVAVRHSPDPTVAAILSQWKRPLTSSSANLRGGPPPRSVEQALEIFGDRPDLEALDTVVLAIDVGALPTSLPSTIVSCLQSPPRLLREGPVSREELQAVLPGLQ